MHRYHFLDVENLNRHPKTLAGFETWLAQAFDAVQRWLEHPAGIDETDLEFCTAVVRRASQTACRLGGGHLGEPVHVQHMHASAMAVLGRMLVWCQEQHAKASVGRESGEVDINEAAQLLGVHSKTVREYIKQGVLIARDAAPPSSKRPLYKLPLDAVLEFRGSYGAVEQRPKPARHIVGRVAKYTPKNFILPD